MKSSHAVFFTVMFLIASRSVSNATEDCSKSLIKDIHITKESDFFYRSLFKLMNDTNYNSNKKAFETAFGYEGWDFKGNFKDDSEELSKHLEVDSEQQLATRDLVLISENLSSNSLAAYSLCVLAQATEEGIYAVPDRVTASQVSFRVKYVPPVGNGGTISVIVHGDDQDGCTLVGTGPPKNTIRMQLPSGGRGKTFVVNRDQSADCQVRVEAPKYDETQIVPAVALKAAPEGLCLKFLDDGKQFHVFTKVEDSNGNGLWKGEQGQLTLTIEQIKKKNSSDADFSGYFDDKSRNSIVKGWIKGDSLFFENKYDGGWPYGKVTIDSENGRCSTAGAEGQMTTTLRDSGTYHTWSWTLAPKATAQP